MITQTPHFTTFKATVWWEAASSGGKKATFLRKNPTSPLPFEATMMYRPFYRQKIKNEDISEERSEKSASATPSVWVWLSWTQHQQEVSVIDEELCSLAGAAALPPPCGAVDSSKVFWRDADGLLWLYFFCLFLFLCLQFAFFRMIRNVCILISIISWLFYENRCPLSWIWTFCGSYAIFFSAFYVFWRLVWRDF